MALPLLNVNLVTNNNIGWQQSSLLKSKLIVVENQNPLDPNYKRKSKVLRCVEKQRKEALKLSSPNKLCKEVISLPVPVHKPEKN